MLVAHEIQAGNRYSRLDADVLCFAGLIEHGGYDGPEQDLLD